MVSLPALRQVVLLSGDLSAALDATKAHLGLNAGIRDAQSMAELGFEHEVLAIESTFVEIVSPLSADSSAGRLLARKGEGGYMVVVQVPDVEAMLGRAAGIGLKPIMNELFEGNLLTQWHPRDLGTLAEFDEMRVGDWHFCPELSDTGSTAVVADLVSVEVAVPDPAEYARRWATLLDVPLSDGATILDLSGRTVAFVPQTGRGGLTGVRFAAADPTATDRTQSLCGVSFTIAAQATDRPA